MEEQIVMSQTELSSTTITKLAKAMLKVLKAIGPAFKDKANDFTKKITEKGDEIIQLAFKSR